MDNAIISHILLQHLSEREQKALMLAVWYFLRDRDVVFREEFMKLLEAVTECKREVWKGLVVQQ